MDGVVYAAFGSMCDGFPWAGWIFGVSTTTHSITARFSTIVDDTSGAGIWQAGSGLVSDRDGEILFSTGNGGWDLGGPTPGNQPPNDLAEAVASVVVQPDGSLKPVDFFAPYDAVQLEKNDLDFGSGGPVALPDQYFGTNSHPHLLVMEGKQGYVYLLDRDNLGGYLQGPSGGDGVVNRIGPYGGVWSRPTVWPGNGGYVYFVTANGAGGEGSGTSGFLRAYKYGVDGAGDPTLTLARVDQRDLRVRIGRARRQLGRGHVRQFAALGGLGARRQRRERAAARVQPRAGERPLHARVERADWDRVEVLDGRDRQLPRLRRDA